MRNQESRKIQETKLITGFEKRKNATHDQQWQKIDKTSQDKTSQKDKTNVN